MNIPDRLQPWLHSAHSNKTAGTWPSQLHSNGAARIPPAQLAVGSLDAAASLLKLAAVLAARKSSQGPVCTVTCTGTQVQHVGARCAAQHLNGNTN